MKTVRDIENASLTDDLQTSAMSMVLNATSFNHIISNLYRNPLGAVMRELTTNALESHIIAGTDKRVAIQLPTALDQEFVIRDFGTGLTHDQVEKYLNSLFSSSKDGDNNMMGGFGLGSKSPLALVDTFNLVSICNGKKNTYAWIKEGGKLPSLVRMGDEEDYDEPTKEHSGLKIVVPLGSSSKLDVSRLESICKFEARLQLFCFTKEKLILTDNIHTSNYEDLNDITSSILLEELLLSLPTVDVFKRSTQDLDGHSVNQVNGQYVSIGGVAYPYSFSGTNLSSLTNAFQTSNQYLFAIKAPIGSLDLPMSREEVLDTVNNQTLIANLVKQAEGEVQDHIRSLNIDLDCSLTDYYAQMENMRGTTASTTVTSGGVQFNLDISDSTFEKYEDLLIKSFKEAYTRQNPYSSGGVLRYSNLRSDHKFFDNLAFKFLELQGMKMFKYSSAMTDRDRLKESWYYGGPRLDLRKENFSFVMTSTPLPKGITTYDLEMYIREELKPNHRVILIQVEDELKESAERIMEIGIAWQKAFCDPTHNPETEYLGYLDGEEIKEYRKAVRDAQKANTTTITRSTYDFVPGLRVQNLSDSSVHIFGSSLGFTVSDDKVYKLIDSNGKTVGAGPEYLSANQKVKKVILIEDERSLPFDLSDFINATDNSNNFNPRASYAKEILEDFVVMKVQSRSFDKALERFESEGYTVYTNSGTKFKIEKPKLDDADEDVKTSILFPYLTNYVYHNISTARSYGYSRNAHLKLVNKVVLNGLKKLPENDYQKTMIKKIEANLQNENLFDDRNMSSLKFMYDFDEKAVEGSLTGLVDCASEVFSEDTSIQSNLINLIKSETFRDHLIERYLQSLVKQKGNNP